MPADGVVMDTPATCGPVTCDTDTALPMRRGVTREFGRRGAPPFSLDLTGSVVDEEAESADKRAEPELDTGAEPANVPATTTTTLPSGGSTFISGVIETALAGGAVPPVDCPIPQ